jgi:hypothetical protein
VIKPPEPKPRSKHYKNVPSKIKPELDARRDYIKKVGVRSPQSAPLNPLGASC